VIIFSIGININIIINVVININIIIIIIIIVRNEVSQKLFILFDGEISLLEEVGNDESIYSKSTTNHRDNSMASSSSSSSLTSIKQNSNETMLSRISSR